MLAPDGRSGRTIIIIIIMSVSGREVEVVSDEWWMVDCGGEVE
jgi:hypothetical protein